MRSYADEEAIDLLEEHRDEIFVGPAVGIMWANVYEGAECGIDSAMAETMGSPASLAAMIDLYPKLRVRGRRGPDAYTSGCTGPAPLRRGRDENRIRRADDSGRGTGDHGTRSLYVPIAGDNPHEPP